MSFWDNNSFCLWWTHWKSPLQKRAGLPGISTKSCPTEYSKTRHKPHNKSGEVPSRRKRVPKAGKRVRKGSETLSTVRNHSKAPIQQSQHICRGLVQTHAGSMTATSVSVSPHELRLVDSVVCVLVVSSTPLTPTIPLPPFLQGSSVLSGGTWWRPLTWTLSPTNIWLWVSALALISCRRQPLWWWLD